jgi:hypothetical protein
MVVIHTRIDQDRDLRVNTAEGILTIEDTVAWPGVPME